MARLARAGVAFSIGALGVALVAAVPAYANTELTLNPDHSGVTASEFKPQDDDCGNAGDEDGWHFVAPADSNFLELTVTFDLLGGSDLTVTLDDPSDFPENASHAFVITPAGATLTVGTAIVDADDLEQEHFQLSHTCPGTVPEPEPEPIPGVTGTEVCATNEDGESGLEITLTNSGDADATFNVEGVGPVVVGPDKSETILIPIGEDEPYDVEITEETTGTTWGFKGTLNCEEPEPEPAPGPGAGFTESCVDGGVIVYLDNIGEADAVFTVEALVNGEPLEPVSETVPPGEATESVLELESGDAYEIVVTDETTFFAFVDGTFECVEEEPEPSTEPTTGPSPAPGERGGALPKTGAGFPTATAAWLGVFLLATGGFLLTWRRGMLPIPYRRKD